jgi:phenylacetate-CoA ligase
MFTSKLLNYFKTNRIELPIWFGLFLNKIPYSKRPGISKLYRSQSILIKQFKTYTNEEKENYIVNQFMNIFTHAYHNINFYRDLYKEQGIEPGDIKTINDIKKIPVITKSDLKKYDLEDRSFNIKNRLLVNTGGSSGNPFSFYMDPLRYGNEWAHIHDMWSVYGYKPSDLKLVFGGRIIVNNKIIYDFARNSLLYDIYGDKNAQAEQLLKILRIYPIKYLHGYPSAIYEFALYCETNDILLFLLKKNLKAVFLSSESPSPHYRDKIENVFGIPTQSFYGHTETCVMAIEEEKNIYNTYQTYGFAEAIEYDKKFHLIGTSYFNYASPLIRYDTEDIIEPLNADENILSKFRIAEGRIGEYILDKNKKKIPLTGLIFGRHHQLFNYSNHIQVFQNNPGEATILFVPNRDVELNEVYNLFNSENVDIVFNFKKIEKPILTKSGKFNLKVKSFDLEK